MNRAASRPPAYRRRILVEPADGRVRAMLEDDMHCMAVTLHHRSGRVISIDAAMHRAPWDTCPGARAMLVHTFVGSRLDEVTARREKKQNCTHLHDLAVLAAAHANDPGPTEWNITVSDPVDGRRNLTIVRDGATLHRWDENAGVLTAPPPVSGATLFSLRDWIGTLPGVQQEAARLLQWAGLVAHGRTIPMDHQSDARALPANCFTLQPERAALARRTGEMRDFSSGDVQPLDGLRGTPIDADAG